MPAAGAGRPGRARRRAGAGWAAPPASSAASRGFRSRAGLAEGAPRRGLGAELAVRPPFDDVEIDLHQPPLAAAPGRARARAGIRSALRTKLRPCQRNRFFAACWVMVEPPRTSARSPASSIPRSPRAIRRNRRRDGRRSGRPRRRSRRAAAPARCGRAASRCARRARRSPSATASGSRPDRRSGRAARADRAAR